MNSGFQRTALVAYIALCIYLIAQPAPNRLDERAATLDQQLASKSPKAVATALAVALKIPEQKVDIYLSLPDSKPSDLVFAKLLNQCGITAETETPADTIVHNGMPAREALAFFDEVETTVERTLAATTSAEAHGELASHN